MKREQSEQQACNKVDFYYFIAKSMKYEFWQSLQCVQLLVLEMISIGRL